MTLMFKNNANSRLKIDTAAASTTVTVLAGEGDRFPQPVGDGSDSFTVTLEDRRTGQVEIMLCTARSADILAVTRALEGTPAQDFLAGATVSSRPTAGLWTQIFGYGWSKSEADARFVDVAGDTMIGPLTLPGDPVDPTHATTKSWVETLVGSVTSLTEAPIDGQAYVRQDAAWAVGVTKVYVDSQDATLNSLIGGLDGDITALQAEIDALEIVVAPKLDDAPSDGNFYARSDGAWVETITEAEYDVFVSNTNASLDTKIPEAPTDGTGYVRASAAWAAGVLKSVYDAFVTATNNNLTTINADQITQNNRLTAAENKNTSQDTAINSKLGDAPSDGLVYGRKNAAWATVIGGAHTDDNPPAPPLQDGQLWWQASTGNTFIWYVDANGGQWVQQNTAALAASGQVGEVSYFDSDVAPPGFLIADGASYPTNQYPHLFAKTGYRNGGSGSNFNVINLLGEFIRGWDKGRGVDPGRALGSAQDDAYENHTHTADALPGHLHGAGGSTAYSSGSAIGNATNMGQAQNTAHNRMTQTVSAGTPSINASTTGDVETRPRNVALLPCVRYLPTVEEWTGDTPNDGNEYTRVNGVWRLSKQVFKPVGVGQIVPIPAAAVRAKIDATLWYAASTAGGMRWSIDGSTFPAGATDYTYSGQTMYGGSTSNQKLAPTNLGYVPAHGTQGYLLQPAHFDAVLDVVKPSATSSHQFAMQMRGTSFDAATTLYAQEYLLWVYGSQASLTAAARLAAFQIISPTGIAFVAGTNIEVEWGY